MTEAARVTSSPADPVQTRPGGGEAAAGPASPAGSAARLTADPFGLIALGGNLRLMVFTGGGVRTLRVQLHGQAVDVECDDDARAALEWHLARPVRP